MHGSKKFRITLAQLFSLSLIGLIALLVLLFYLLLHASKDSVIQASNNLRMAASRELAEKVTGYLDQLSQVEDSFQLEVTHEVFNPQDPIALETYLFAALLSNSNLSEISLIYGDKVDYGANGNIQLAPTHRGEMSLFRESTQGSSAIDTRYTYQENGVWVRKLRARLKQNDLLALR